MQLHILIVLNINYIEIIYNSKGYQKLKTTWTQALSCRCDYNEIVRLFLLANIIMNNSQWFAGVGIINNKLATFWIQNFG